MAEISFGEWLKRRRKAAGLTQEQLALQISCSTSAVKKIEAEERRPSAQIVERLAEIFGIPANEHPAFLRFARGDWQAALAEFRQEPPWGTGTTFARSNIPAPSTSLIGRENEIRQVRAYLERSDVRLVTLLGPPGIGKTRLSIESAHVSIPDFPAGVFFVAFAPLDDPALVGTAITRALGYVGSTNLAANEQLKEGIGNRRMLIVLDNCEHLIEPIALLASELIAACPRLKLVATSRESMRISGEWIYPVPAFDVPREISSVEIESALKLPALTLFAERARAVRPDFELNSENAKTVAAICARLDGLPLAIELIAARMHMLSPQSLLKRLNDSSFLSAGGVRNASARQKTLQDAIGWSYNLLSGQEQKFFSCLAVFSGGFSLAAAESIFPQSVSGKSVSDVFASLLHKSLLHRTFDARGEPRFDMLVTIQLFALDQLQNTNEEAGARNQHLTHFLDFAARGDKEIRGANQVEWLKKLGAEGDNLRAALEWAIASHQTESALQLARKLHWYWFVRGDYVGARRWLKRVLELPDASLYPHAQAEALTQLAYHNMQLGELAVREARPLLEQAHSIARTNHDKENTDRTLAMLGLLLVEEGDFTSAQSMLKESMARFQQAREEWDYAHTVLCLGVQSQRQKEWAAALALSRQAYEGFKRLGDTYFQSAALRLVGRAAVHQGNLADGTAALRQALLLAQQLDNKFQIALILWRSLAEAAQFAGETARAVSLITTSINMFQSIGAWMEDDDLLFEQELAPCRAALGESAFAAAMEQGRAMTMEQAIVYALGY